MRIWTLITMVIVALGVVLPDGLARAAAPIETVVGSAPRLASSPKGLPWIRPAASASA